VLLIELQPAQHTQRLHGPVVFTLVINSTPAAQWMQTRPVHLKNSTYQTTQVHITAIVSYGDGERWSERREKLSVTMAALKKNVYLLMVQGVK